MPPELAALLPRLFEPTYIAYADADVRFTTAEPPPELIHRVHVVARTGDGVVVCRSEQGWRFLPGGRLEPGEEITHAVDRELREEAGARRVGALRVIGAHVADSRRPEPYRPHAPHPRMWWVYAVTDVVVDAEPANPPDGEHIVEVRVLPPAEAAAWLDVEDPISADVVRLAGALGEV